MLEIAQYSVTLTSRIGQLETDNTCMGMARVGHHHLLVHNTIMVHMAQCMCMHAAGSHDLDGERLYIETEIRIFTNQL